MIPAIDTDSATPLYQQLYHYYKKAIHANQLSKGIRMPSVRQLAKELTVSNNTVVKCYEQLTDEGYLVNLERKGLYVGDIQQLDRKNLIHSRASELPKVKPSKIKYNLGRSVVEENKFPMKEWRWAQQQALDFLSFQYLQYDFYSETAGLKEQLVSFLYRYRGVQCKKEQVVIGAGCNSLFTLLALLLKKEHSTILFEEPGFEHARSIFDEYGYHIETIAVGKDGIELTQLAKKKSKLIYLTPCHQYPTGVVMPTGNRVKLLNWVQGRGAYIIEDDYDSIFRHRSKPIPALQGLDVNGRVIYIGTLSKLFIPSLRIAYMVLPEPLLQELSRFQYLAYTVPYQTQRAMSLFMEKGYLERHLRRMQKLYKEKYYATLRAMKKVFGQQVAIIETEAGLSVLIEVKTRLSEEELIGMARQKGIAVRGAAVTYLHRENAPSHPQIFIGFGNMPFEKIETIFKTLREVWFG